MGIIYFICVHLQVLCGFANINYIRLFMHEHNVHVNTLAQVSALCVCACVCLHEEFMYLYALNL